MIVITNINIDLHWKKDPIKGKIFHIRPDVPCQIDYPEVLQYLRDNYRNNIILTQNQLSDLIDTNTFCDKESL